MVQSGQKKQKAMFSKECSLRCEEDDELESKNKSIGSLNFSNQKKKNAIHFQKSKKSGKRLGWTTKGKESAKYKNKGPRRRKGDKQSQRY